MNKSEMIRIISNNSNKYGNLIIECLHKYKKYGTRELTKEELQEFINEKGLKMIEKNNNDIEKDTLPIYQELYGIIEKLQKDNDELRDVILTERINSGVWRTYYIELTQIINALKKVTTIEECKDVDNKGNINTYYTLCFNSHLPELFKDKDIMQLIKKYFKHD